MTSGSKAQTGTKATTSVTLAGDVTGPSSANTVAKINGSPLGTTTGATTGYVLTWNGSAWVPAAGASGGVTSFNTRTGAVVPANADYLAVATGGLTGATNATRYVGGTANGAPSSGTFAVGDFIVDATASVWICVVAGTPGTWASSISNHVTLRSATATAKYNEITLFTGSTAGQTISAAGSPIDSVTWSVINNSSVPLTLSFSANAMYPLGSSSTVTSYTVGVASAYSFVNYNGGNWYMTATNDLSNGTGIVAVANGGTGTSTAPAVGGVPYATSSTAYAPLAIGTAGQVLTVNSGATAPQWSTPTTTTSVTMGGDVTGNSATSTVAKLQGTSVSSTAPTSNQVLTYNSGTSSWTPTTPTAGSLTPVSNIITSDIVVASATPTTILSSTSLSNGTYLITGGVQVSSTGGTGYVQAYLGGNGATTFTNLANTTVSILANGTTLYNWLPLNFVFSITGTGSFGYAVNFVSQQNTKILANAGGYAGGNSSGIAVTKIG